MGGAVNVHRIRIHYPCLTAPLCCGPSLLLGLPFSHGSPSTNQFFSTGITSSFIMHQLSLFIGLTGKARTDKDCSFYISHGYSEICNQYPYSFKNKSLSRHLGRTFTNNSRNTLLSRNFSISTLASLPIFLIICPPVPIKIAF